jgi:hypothetical protein
VFPCHVLPYFVATWTPSSCTAWYVSGAEIDGCQQHTTFLPTTLLCLGFKHYLPCRRCVEGWGDLQTLVRQPVTHAAMMRSTSVFSNAHTCSTTAIGYGAQQTCSGGSGADEDRSAGGFQNSGGGSLQATWSHMCRVPQPPAHSGPMPLQQLPHDLTMQLHAGVDAMGQLVIWMQPTKQAASQAHATPLTVSSKGVSSSGEGITFLGRPVQQHASCPQHPQQRNI